jgi:hypothetical protein
MSMSDRQTAEPKSPPPSPPPVPFALKAAVIVMGIMLVAGLVVVFSTIIYRTVKPVSPGAPQLTRTDRSGAIVTKLGIPADSIRQMSLNGNRLAIRTAREIIIIDYRKGLVIGRIALKAK